VRRVSRLGAAAVLLLAVAPAVHAQTDTITSRLRVSEEVTASTAPARRWTAASLFTASAETTMSWRERIALGATIGIQAANGTQAAKADVRVRAREGYVRWSASRWLDVEGGRRIVKWGTGYAFTPTGVLDPLRDATDPQDRLGVNEGVDMAKVDAYAGPASLTVVASERTHAARLRTTVRGVEMAVIATAAAGQRPSWGGNVTHVIGDRLEWHGELLSGEEGATGRRGVSALLGGQYTFSSGPNLVLEYYRSSTPDPRSGETSFLFARVSRGVGDLALTPDALVIVGLRDRAVTVVPSLGIAIGDHVQMYVRALVNSTPRVRSLTTGLMLRF
jgi:hypothetical protein